MPAHTVRNQISESQNLIKAVFANSGFQSFQQEQTSKTVPAKADSFVNMRRYKSRGDFCFLRKTIPESSESRLDLDEPSPLNTSRAAKVRKGDPKKPEEALHP